MEKVRIYRIGNSLTVHNGAVENSRICVTSLDLSEGYHQVVENQLSHTFEDIPGVFQVTITAPNYLPYTYLSGTATGTGKQQNLCFRAYPNPVSDRITVEVDVSGGVLQIIDLHGRIFQEQVLVPGVQSIEISSLPDGTYTLLFQTDYGFSREKMVKLVSN